MAGPLLSAFLKLSIGGYPHSGRLEVLTGHPLTSLLHTIALHRLLLGKRKSRRSLIAGHAEKESTFEDARLPGIRARQFFESRVERNGILNGQIRSLGQIDGSAFLSALAPRRIHQYLAHGVRKDRSHLLSW